MTHCRAYRTGLAACLLWWAALLSAQAVVSPEVDLRDSSQQHLLRTRRGDRLLGRLLFVQAPEAGFRLRSGDTLFFDLSSLKTVEVLKPPRLRQKTPTNILFPDLFVSNTAYSLEKGLRQFRNTQLAWNYADFAATNHYAIGLGYLLPFHLLVRTKAASSSENRFNLGAGINFLFSLGPGEEFPRKAHFYTALSLGEADKFFNINAGYAIDLSRGSRSGFLFSGGGAFRLSKHWFILADNLLLMSRDGGRLYPGLGLSYAGKHARLDLGYFYFTTFTTETASSPGIGYSRFF